jgi:hypothetical protein
MIEAAGVVRVLAARGARSIVGNLCPPAVDAAVADAGTQLGWALPEEVKLSVSNAGRLAVACGVTFRWSVRRRPTYCQANGFNW